MKDYIFYTPPSLAEAIFSLMEKRSYNNVIDICCGSMNLLNAAKKVFKCKRVTGIDTDKNAKLYKAIIDDFYNTDGRLFAIKKKNRNKYDLVLSNPPYGYIQESERIVRDYVNNNNTLTKEDRIILTKRYESEMIVANIMLLKREGEMFLILPQTVLYGLSFQKMREFLSKNLWIKAIIELPQGTFKKDDISTVAFILKRTDKRGDTYMYKAVFKDEWYLEKKGILYKQMVDAGKWFENADNNKVRNDKVYRGIIGTNKFCDKGKNKVIHCSSIYENKSWKPSIRYTGEHFHERIVHKGDVIINRIGKFAGYWTISDVDGYEVSDCIIIIKQPSNNTICKLKKSTINGKLDILKRGVATKYITQDDICRLIL